MQRNSILIIGSFYNPRNKRHYTSAAEQLAALFKKNHIPVITTTKHYHKISRFLSTLYDIIRNCNRFSIAILPLYGTSMNFIWHQASAILLKLLGKKLVIAVHGGSIPGQIDKGEKKFFKALDRADKIVCPSAFMADFLNQYNYNASVIENVLDIGAYPYQYKKSFRPHVLWMRSFSAIYNPLMAVRTAALLVKKFPDFKMVMAGSDHGLMDATKKFIESSNLQSKIYLPGYIDHARKISYAKDYDIYINTNDIDNAPVTVVENMALGLAVISVNTGGISYIINNEVNGLLVEANNPMLMADAVERIISDASMATQLCDRARQDAMHFDEACVLRKWKALLSQLAFTISDRL